MNDKFTNTQDELDNLLTQTAQSTKPGQNFALELEDQLKQIHDKKLNRRNYAFTQKQTVSTLAWGALLVAFAIILNWTIKSIVPAPTSVPAANISSTPSNIETSTTSTIEPQATPILNLPGYDWRGTKLFLNAPLPNVPTDANIYVLKEDQPATVEQALALAEQLGIQGDIYVSTNPGTGATEYLVTDGRQSVSVTTDRLYTYTADMARGFNNLGGHTSPNAETTINEFLSSHGFDFSHRVAKGELFGGYIVEPLSPEGTPMRYEFFSSRPMKVLLDENGQVLQLEANLMDYEQVGTQTYSIISAEEAFQKMMDDNTPNGKIESALSSSSTVQSGEWRIAYPQNETITIYGYAFSTPALDPSKPAFNQIDGYTVTGNTNGFETLQRNSFVQATGQFIEENRIEKFNIESWKISDNMQDGIVGNLSRENGQVLFNTEQGEQLIIQPDVPADLPMPYENAFVLGIRKPDNIYEWTLIDDRANSNSGGGGGGGGQGFYKLNLSGTPVPFPTTSPAASNQETSEYIVQENDTLASIAMNFGVSVSELSKVNSLSDENIIYLGQTLIIPGTEVVQPNIGRRFEALRGTVLVEIYRDKNGNQRIQNAFMGLNNDGSSQLYILDGIDLQAYQNKVLEITGTLDHIDNNFNPVIKVDQFQDPYPNAQFEIVRGTQNISNINGQDVTILTASDGREFAELTPYGEVFAAMFGDIHGKESQLEVLILPDEYVGDYPALRVFSGIPVTNTGEELQITADQIPIIDESLNTNSEENYTPPTLTIEKVELMYYVTNPHWQVDHLDGTPLYIQPVWRFYGHYDNGGEFEVIVQALQEEYLLPELAPLIPPG